MAIGTDFGGIHSYRDLHLVQSKVDVQPAIPKLNLIDIPGSDGPKDLSEQPAGRIVYSDREIEWTFALYSGDNWEAKQRQVSKALNGRACKITLDSDPDYYYYGRLSVKKYKKDGLLRQITINATCRPYMLKQQETTVSASLTTTAKTLTLANECKPVVPKITVSTAVTITYRGNSYSVSAGTHELLDLELLEGSNTMTVKTTSGSGTISIVYREGAL